MKWYESRYTGDQFMPMVPVLARLDGRSFHSFTKGLKRPYDERLTGLMVETTQLVQETNARCGYTQSDEITLVWLAEEWESDIFFAGKLQKMNSILASMTTAFFNRLMPTNACRRRPNWLT
jgi:tRNA(His) guanylyltransferase